MVSTFGDSYQLIRRASLKGHTLTGHWQSLKIGTASVCASDVQIEYLLLFTGSVAHGGQCGRQTGVIDSPDAGLSKRATSGSALSFQSVQVGSTLGSSVSASD